MLPVPWSRTIATRTYIWRFNNSGVKVSSVPSNCKTYIYRLFLRLPLISFTASAAHEMSAHAQIMSAHLTEPATANGPTREWLEHTTNRSRSSTKLTVLASSTGKNPEQAHRRNF
jgi:hypothetical protein